MTGPVYTAATPDSLKQAPLGELTALYHRPSAQTHIVSEPVPEILAALQQGAVDAGVLLDRLGVSGEGAREAIEARLAEIEAIGLVSRG